mgnify:CR=1 FL=1
MENNTFNKSILDFADELSQIGKEDVYRSLFSNALKEYFGVEYVVLTSSCTSALFLSLKNLGIGKGDEVILPTNTYPSTIAPIVHLNAIPILCDAVSLTENINIDDMENNITPKTKCIIIVHQNGYPTNMDKVQGIAQKYNIPIIEDNARSFGAKWKNNYCGTLGYSGCLSFNSLKILSACGGGAILTSDEKLYENAKLFAGYGTDYSNKFVAPGYNFKISALNCLIGVEKIKMIDNILKKRESIAEKILEGLKPFSNLILPYKLENSNPVFPTLPIQIKHNCTDIRKFLHSQNIPTHSNRAIHIEPYYKEQYFSQLKFPIAKQLCENSFCLHIDEHTNNEQIDKIIDAFHIFTQL